MARRQNNTFSDQQSGRLQQRASRTRTAPAADAPLPDVGASVALGIYGTCTVLGHELGPGGITMIELQCTGAGHKTFIGQRFKLSGPLVVRLISERRAYAADEQLTRFFGRVAGDCSRLGLSAWLPFLRWFQSAQPDVLPAAEEPQKFDGPVADLYTLHERTLRGFALQPPTDQRVVFTVCLERNGVRIMDDLPAEDIRRIAAAIADEPAEDHAWRRYRRFVAAAITRQVDATRQIVRYAVERQQQWLRTGRLLDQQRLTRSSTGLVKACDVSSSMACALAGNIGMIRIGDREVEFESLFTRTDFEREHVVVALTNMCTAMGVNDIERLTLAQERELRERASAVLNAEMPLYLQRPISDERFRRCLAFAAAQTKPTSMATAAASRLWDAEGDALRTVFRRHGWRYTAAAATLGTTTQRLVEQVHRHDLAQGLLDDRHEFVRRIYLKAIPPGVQTHDDLKMAGVRAVATALQVAVATELDDKQYAEDWVRAALIAADVPRADDLQRWQIAIAFVRHHGSIRLAARDLHLREHTLIDLVDRFQLWDHVQGHENLKRARRIPVR